jgi:hypothetical protein
MEVRNTTFFIVNCAIIRSSRNEYVSISRYWTTASRLAITPTIASSKTLSRASEMGHRLESSAIIATRAKMIATSIGKKSGSWFGRTARRQTVAIASIKT